MPTKINSIGILAGEGEIPHILIDHCLQKNLPVCAVQFDGCAYSRFPDIPVLNTRIERVGEVFKFFKSNQVSDVVLIGNLSRPSPSSLRPDWKGVKVLSQLAMAFTKGDDTLLRTLRHIIEDEGFTVRGADYFIDDLTLPVGVHTTTTSTSDYTSGVQESIKHGIDDKGQSILMHVDGTFSHETRSGTTALILNEGRAGSILIKMTKPQQDPDLDRPTVGLDTLKALHKVGASGLVIQAQSVFAIHKNAMVKYANDHNLFIEAVKT